MPTLALLAKLASPIAKLRGSYRHDVRFSWEPKLVTPDLHAFRGPAPHVHLIASPNECGGNVRCTVHICDEKIAHLDS